METTAAGRRVPQAEGGPLAGKYLTFNLGQELYGVEILRVQEIIGVLPVTKVPQTADFIKGVINLRGKVIPVIDLRLKLGMAERDYDEETCIIVVNMPLDAQTVAIGVVVDSVREVYDFAASQLELTPRFGVDADASSILGIGKIGEAVVMLLDIGKAIGAGEREVLAQLRKPADGGA